jgi:hypothetical protein
LPQLGVSEIKAAFRQGLKRHRCRWDTRRWQGRHATRTLVPNCRGWKICIGFDVGWMRFENGPSTPWPWRMGDLYIYMGFHMAWTI